MTSINDGAQAIQEFSDTCVRFGITTVQNMSWTPPERYVQMAGAAQVPLRIRLIDFPAAVSGGREAVPSVEERARQAASAGPRVTRSGRKWILDGTPVEFASDFGFPYHGRETGGAQNFPTTEVDRMLEESLAANDQILLHAIGTETVRTVINSLKRTGSDVDWAARGMRIEHIDGAETEEIAAIKQLGAMPVVNPSHFLLTDMYADRLGTGHNFSPLRSLVEADVPFGIGSDGPLNPYLGLFAATVHPTRMSEAISVEDAVRAYTVGGALAEGTADEKGQLAVGYLADLAVLSQDIFEARGPQLIETHSVLTMIGGDIVWRDGV